MINKRIQTSYLSDWWKPHRDDLKAAAKQAVLKARDDYRAEGGTAFASLATVAIRNAMARRANQLARVFAIPDLPAHLHAPTDSDPTPDWMERIDQITLVRSDPDRYILFEHEFVRARNTEAERQRRSRAARRLRKIYRSQQP